MARKGGTIVEVLEGLSKGRFGEAPYYMQLATFVNANKLYVKLYHDAECTKRVVVEGKNLVGLIDAAKVKRIGFYD